MKPSNYVFFERNPNQNFHKKIIKKGKINIIYSQWTGYLKKEYEQYFSENINELRTNKNYNFHTIHTSGHATTEDLIQFIQSLNPRKVFPIHTAFPNQFQKICKQNMIKNVEPIHDQKTYTLN